VKAVSTWWSRQSALVRWPVGIVATIALYGVAYLVVSSVFGLDADDDELAIRSVLLLVALPMFGFGVLLQRRRLGGKGQLALYRRAYRTGTIPAGADVDRWRPVARRQARFFREGGRLQRVVAVAMMVLLVLLAVVALVAARGKVDVVTAVLVVLGIAMFGLLYWGVDRLWRMRRPQFHRLERALAQHPNQHPAGA
jgi:hypothetical protein